MNVVAIDKTKDLRVNEKKWTKALMNAGWTVFPNIIIERQKALGLDPLDLNIILHLASYWWKPESRPHPSKRTIAEACGCTPRTVQRRIASLEGAGFIKREERRETGVGSKTNIYHLDGLIKAATPYATEKLEEVAEREEARKKRVARKGKAKIKLARSNDD
jgi:DNA-binding transcriptional regulator YhcF (GntR family)